MMEQPGSFNHPVTIYISAAADLMAERETLSHMIAALPVTLTWRIEQSPLRNEPLDLTALQQADWYLLAMGSDIRAPVGLEWRTAQRARRPIVAFLKQGVARTPAGQAFIRETEVTWRPFRDAMDLSQQGQALLIDHLLRQATYYALSPVEVEQLLGASQPEVAPNASGDTGHSAIILSPERYIPSTGTVI